jgi:hypothetical protein
MTSSIKIHQCLYPPKMMLFLEQASRRKQSKDIVPEQEVVSPNKQNEVTKDIVLVLVLQQPYTK